MLSRLPRVVGITWERVALEFDDIGPDACMEEIVDDLLASNPHYLEMASICARDIGDHQRIMVGFGMFYRILSIGARDAGPPTTLPRITLATRDTIVAMIDEVGTETFVLLATQTLKEENPYLLQMADSFASRQEKYLEIMQGFLLLYKALAAQAVMDGLRLNASKGVAGPPTSPS